MKYAFIDKYRSKLPVNLMCRELSISRARYYAYKKHPVVKDSRIDLELRAHIVRISAKHRRIPGALKMWKLLQAENIKCGKHRTAMLRELEGIRATRTKKFRVMTVKQHVEPPAPNTLNRKFKVDAPNKVWVGDITSIRTLEGWLHLAMVLDLFARRIVGWATAPTQGVELPLAALNMAIAQRQPSVGLLFHSDQGSVYGATAYRAILALNGIEPSMSQRGNCHDNAVAESFFSNLKNEVMEERLFATREEAHLQIQNYIEVYYNQIRLHQTLDYQTPVQVETAHLSVSK